MLVAKWKDPMIILEKIYSTISALIFNAMIMEPDDMLDVSLSISLFIATSSQKEL